MNALAAMIQACRSAPLVLTSSATPTPPALPSVRPDQAAAVPPFLVILDEMGYYCESTAEAQHREAMERIAKERLELADVADQAIVERRGRRRL